MYQTGSILLRRLAAAEGLFTASLKCNQNIESAAKLWFGTCSVCKEKVASHGVDKFLSSLKDLDDDLDSYDERQPQNIRKMKSSPNITDRDFSFQQNRYQRTPNFPKYNNRNARGGGRDFRRQRSNFDSFDNNSYSERADMSELYQKVRGMGRTFHDTPIQKNFYEEHPHVKARNMGDIQEYLNKHEISIEGAQKKRPIFEFSETGFPDEILSALNYMDFNEPSPIQCVAWPHALSGSDVVGIAQTGSGKTLSFLLPGFVHAMERKKAKNIQGRGPVVLVVCPTRELAMQICKVASDFRRSCSLSSLPIYGGQSKDVQMKKLHQRNPEIVAATPGRLLDLFSCDAISLADVSYVVLDEADRMLDMGLEPQLRAIMEHIQPQRQVLMFSATWPYEVHNIARDYLTDYVHMKIGACEQTINPDVQLEFVQCNYYDKTDKLVSHLQDLNGGDPAKPIKALVFCGKKVTCGQVSRDLQRSGIRSNQIHGGCSQAARDQAMHGFRSGYFSVLVASDVAARGIDVSDIDCVINYDMPTNVDSFIHRVGRTARAGRKGTAISFVTENDQTVIKELTKLLREINHEVPEFFYTLDRQGRRLKNTRKNERNMERFFRSGRNFRY